jgi:hypothetical protein
MTKMLVESSNFRVLMRKLHELNKSNLVICVLHVTGKVFVLFCAISPPSIASFAISIYIILRCKIAKIIYSTKQNSS